VKVIKVYQGLLILLCVVLVFIICVTLITNANYVNIRLKYESLDLLKCKLYNLNISDENKSLVKVINEYINSSTNYEVIHRELNPFFEVNYSSIGITQTEINYSKTIVTTWVFRKINNTEHEIVIRIYHSLLDYIVGNNDPRAYMFFCIDSSLVMYRGSTRYTLANSLAYYIEDLRDYCYKYANLTNK